MIRKVLDLGVISCVVILLGLRAAPSVSIGCSSRDCELRSLRGGQSCNDCEDDSQVFYECAHFSEDDTCLGTECIENTIMWAQCQEIESSDGECTTSTDPSALYATQDLNDGVCATDDASAGFNFNEIQFPDFCSFNNGAVGVRCSSNSCGGVIIASSERFGRPICGD
jgi:hypothetical protein